MEVVVTPAGTDSVFEPMNVQSPGQFAAPPEVV